MLIGTEYRVHKKGRVYDGGFNNLLQKDKSWVGNTCNAWCLRKVWGLSHVAAWQIYSRDAKDLSAQDNATARVEWAFSSSEWGSPPPGKLFSNSACFLAVELVNTLWALCGPWNWTKSCLQDLVTSRYFRRKYLKRRIAPPSLSWDCY